MLGHTVNGLRVTLMIAALYQALRAVALGLVAAVGLHAVALAPLASVAVALTAGSLAAAVVLLQLALTLHRNLLAPARVAKLLDLLAMVFVVGSVVRNPAALISGSVDGGISLRIALVGALILTLADSLMFFGLLLIGKLDVSQRSGTDPEAKVDVTIETLELEDS